MKRFIPDRQFSEDIAPPCDNVIYKQRNAFVKFADDRRHNRIVIMDLMLHDRREPRTRKCLVGKIHVYGQYNCRSPFTLLADRTDR